MVKMDITQLTVSKESPLLIHELTRSPHGAGIGQISKEPIKTYYNISKLWKDLELGVFDKLENSNMTDSFMKKQSPYSYDDYLVFVDNGKSSKFNSKHESMLRVPRLTKK